MENIKLLLITLIGTVALVFGGSWFFAKLAGPAPGTTNDNLVIDQSRLVSDNPHVMGAQEQPQHTIVSFSDFLCPACAVTAPRVEALVQQYPDKVRLVARHFPLVNLHPQAAVLAQVSEAAAAQGKFWEVHDTFYANQEQLSGLSRQETLDLVWSLTGAIDGLDVEKLQAEWEQSAFLEAVQQDQALARELNLNFTPSVFLNGQLMPIEQIEEVIQNSLDK